MSRVDERLDGVGGFSIDLTEDTGLSVLSRFTMDEADPESLAAATVAVTDAWVDPMALGDSSSSSHHPLFAAARWCGVLTQMNTAKTKLTGHGLKWHLGTPDDGVGLGFSGAAQPSDGDAPVHPYALDSDRWFEWMVEGGPETSIDTATISIYPSPLYGVDCPAAGGVIPYWVQSGWLSRRKLLDGVAAANGWLWHVTPDMVVHAGTPADLFPGGPRCVVAADLDPDPTLVTVRAGDGGLGGDGDLAGWANQVLSVNDKESSTWATWAHPSTTSSPTWAAAATLLGPDLQPLLTQLDQSSENDESILAWAARVLSSEDQILHQERRQVTISGELHDHAQPLRCGEQIWCYDPIAGLVDTTNEVHVSGRVLHPAELPLHGVDWPVLPGMGVYVIYPDRTGTPALKVIDLTPHVVTEDAGATSTLTVGAPAWTI